MKTNVLGNSDLSITAIGVRQKMRDAKIQVLAWACMSAVTTNQPAMVENGPAMKTCVGWHFSSKQARINIIDVGLVRKKNASLLMRSYAGSSGWF
jgi:hypothetical protein